MTTKVTITAEPAHGMTAVLETIERNMYGSVRAQHPPIVLGPAPTEVYVYDTRDLRIFEVPEDFMS